jgi:hypothetical protein
MKKKLQVAERPNKPEGFDVITSFGDMRQKARNFAEGKLPLTIISGPPGVSKSTIFKQELARLGKPFGLVEANASPFGAYCVAWEHRNEPILMDDADGLTQQVGGPRLLKQLGQTDQWKYVSWESKATKGKKALAPSNYFTSSPIAIITNQFASNEENVHIKAIKDRALCYYFYPTSMQIHEYVAPWFWDQEIFNFIAQNLPYLQRVTCRLYVNADRLSLAGDDWKAYVLSHVMDSEDTEQRIMNLLKDKTLASNVARYKKFVDNGWGSRATFYRYLPDVEQRFNLTSVPYIAVKGKRPESQPDPMAGMDLEEEDEEEEKEED